MIVIAAGAGSPAANSKNRDVLVDVMTHMIQQALAHAVAP
jgi:hypothetical protein